MEQQKQDREVPVKKYAQLPEDAGFKDTAPGDVAAPEDKKLSQDGDSSDNSEPEEADMDAKAFQSKKASQADIGVEPRI